MHHSRSTLLLLAFLVTGLAQSLTAQDAPQFAKPDPANTENREPATPEAVPATSQSSTSKPATADAAGSRVIIIETSPNAERSDVIRRIVEALEKTGQLKRAQSEPAATSTEYLAILSPHRDLPYERMVGLIEALKSLAISRAKFVNHDPTEIDSSVVIQCPAEVTWRRVREITETLEKLGDFKVAVQVAANEDTEKAAPVAAEAAGAVRSVDSEIPATKITIYLSGTNSEAVRKTNDFARYVASRTGVSVADWTPNSIDRNKPLITLACYSEPDLKRIIALVNGIRSLGVPDVGLLFRLDADSKSSDQLIIETPALLDQAELKPLWDYLKAQPDFEILAPAGNVIQAATKVLDREGSPIQNPDGLRNAIVDRMRGGGPFGGRPAPDSKAADAPPASSKDEAANNSSSAPDVQIFHLKHADASSVAAISGHLLRRERNGATLVPDERTNSLIMRGNQSLLVKIADLINLLDIPRPAALAGEPISHGVRLPKFPSTSRFPISSNSEGAKLTAFPLQHADVWTVWDMMSQMFADVLLDKVLDSRTNTLLLVADDDLTTRVADVLKLLDVPASATQATDKQSNAKQQPSAPSGDQVVSDLRTNLRDLEQRARNLATQLRQPVLDPSTETKLKEQLNEAVRQSFETRQKLQRAELDEFAQRLKGIQQSIEMRDRTSQQIIDRRVEELLDPNLKWEEADANSGRAQAPRSSAADDLANKIPDGLRRAASDSSQAIDLAVEPSQRPVTMQAIIFDMDAEIAADFPAGTLQHRALTDLGEDYKKLIDEGRLTIVSRPQMRTQLGQPGTVQIGMRMAVLSPDTSETTQLDVGETLQITPREEDGALVLDIKFTSERPLKAAVQTAADIVLQSNTYSFRVPMKEYEGCGVLLGPFTLPNQKLRCVHLVVNSDDAPPKTIPMPESGRADLIESSDDAETPETSKTYSRENRWEVRYPNDPQQFGRALDYFGVELGSADGDTKEISYLSSLSARKLAVRHNLCARESRLFLTEADGESIRLAKTYLDQAGIETRVRRVMWFYSDETAQLLADLEARHAAGKSIELVEKTVFGARPKADGFEYYVISQLLKPAATDAQQTPGKTLNQLQGKWRLTRQIADDGDEGITPSSATWEFKGNRVVARDSGGGGAMIVTIDESHSPIYVDVEIETEEETGLGLLSIEGDVLKICLGKSQEVPDPRSRPEKLEAVRGAWYMELRRMKPGETIESSQPRKRPPGISGETPNADLEVVDPSTKLANASTNLKLAEICSQAHAALSSIETLQYRFEKKDDQGWQSQAEFYADHIRFRVNRKDLTGIMGLDLQPIRNPPMTISSAFDGQKQQYARQNEPVRVKHGRAGGAYGITIPQIWAYGWLRNGAAEFHWDTILSKEFWEQRFQDAIYIGDVTEDGRRFEIVDFPQRLEQVTPCIYRVYFARDLAFLPLKIFRNTLNRNEPSTTVLVTRFKTFTVNGKQIAIPLDVQHRETQADGVSHKGETTITVDEGSLRVNYPLDDSLFTLNDVGDSSASIEDQARQPLPR